MKMIKTLVATMLIFSFAMGSAHARYIGDVTSSTNVNIRIDNGVATLWGNVESGLDRVLVERQAKKIEGVHCVRNLITFSS